MAILVLGVPSLARAATGSVVTSAVTATSPCQDVVFIGARGSDQGPQANRGMGAEVEHAYTSFVMSAIDSGNQANIGYYALPYPAVPVDYALYNSGKAFSASIDLGVTQVLTLMNSRSKRCSETYVLAGYSQGAMVMHRTLLSLYHETGLAAALNVGDGLLKKISGVIAIGDGDRLGAEGGTHYGTAPATGASWGIIWGRHTSPVITSGEYPPFREALPDDSRFHAASFIDVCASGDVVCDFPNSRIEGMRIHTRVYPASASVATAAAKAYQLDEKKRSDAKSMRAWTVGPLTVHLNGDWGPVGSADPSSGWAWDYTSPGNCATCQAPYGDASLGLNMPPPWCTGTIETCSGYATDPRIGDAPAITIGGIAPDYSGRAQVSGSDSTYLFWCFSAKNVCIRYDGPTGVPVQPSPALFDVLSNATWTG